MIIPSKDGFFGDEEIQEKQEKKYKKKCTRVMKRSEREKIVEKKLGPIRMNGACVS